MKKSLHYNSTHPDFVFTEIVAPFWKGGERGRVNKL